MGDKKKQFRHVIREAWCKGCSICIELCPKKVLALQNGKVAVVKPDDCIGCRLCELRCPDFVIDVEDVNQNEDSGVDVANLHLTISPEVG